MEDKSLGFHVVFHHPFSLLRQTTGTDVMGVEEIMFFYYQEDVLLLSRQTVN